MSLNSSVTNFIALGLPLFITAFIMFIVGIAVCCYVRQKKKKRRLAREQRHQLRALQRQQTSAGITRHNQSDRSRSQRSIRREERITLNLPPSYDEAMSEPPLSGILPETCIVSLLHRHYLEQPPTYEFAIRESQGGICTRLQDSYPLTPTLDNTSPNVSSSHGNSDNTEGCQQGQPCPDAFQINENIDNNDTTKVERIMPLRVMRPPPDCNCMQSSDTTLMTCVQNPNIKRGLYHARSRSGLDLEGIETSFLCELDHSNACHTTHSFNGTDISDIDSCRRNSYGLPNGRQQCQHSQNTYVRQSQTLGVHQRSISCPQSSLSSQHDSSTSSDTITGIPISNDTALIENTEDLGYPSLSTNTLHHRSASHDAVMNRKSVVHHSTPAHERYHAMILAQLRRSEKVLRPDLVKSAQNEEYANSDNSMCTCTDSAVSRISDVHSQLSEKKRFLSWEGPPHCAPKDVDHIYYIKDGEVMRISQRIGQENVHRLDISNENNRFSIKNTPNFADNEELTDNGMWI